MKMSILTLTLSYAAPDPPPPSGADWSTERDYPGVYAVVTLPTEGMELRRDLQCNLKCCDEILTLVWGVPHGVTSIIDRAVSWPARGKTRLFRAPTLEEAEKEARAWHAEGEAVIESILGVRKAPMEDQKAQEERERQEAQRAIEAREKREEQRRATIAAAHARPGSIVIPT